MEIRKVLAVLWLVAIAIAVLFVFNYTPVAPIYGPVVTTQTQPTQPVTDDETNPTTIPQVAAPTTVKMIVLNQKAIDAAKSSAMYDQALTILLLLLGSAVLMFARKYTRPFVPRLVAGALGITGILFAIGFLAMNLVPSQEFPSLVALPAICAAAMGPVLALTGPSRKTLAMVDEAGEKITGLIQAREDGKKKIEQLEKDLSEEQAAHEQTFEELETAVGEKDSAVAEASSLKKDLEQVQARAAKAEFTSLAGAAETVLVQKQQEYQEALAVLKAFGDSAESAMATATRKRATAAGLQELAEKLTVEAKESARKILLLQYANDSSDKLRDAEDEAARARRVAGRANGVAYLSKLDAQAAERRAERILAAQQVVEVQTSELADARVAAEAESRRCEIVANAEIKFAEATRMSETAEAQLRQINRVVNLVKVGERDGVELYSPTLAMPQDDTIYIILKASGGSDSALHRTIEPGIVAADEIEVPKGRSITLEIVDVSSVNMTDAYRERHGLPAVLPPYGVGGESTALIN